MLACVVPNVSFCNNVNIALCVVGWGNFTEKCIYEMLEFKAKASITCIFNAAFSMWTLVFKLGLLCYI